MTTHNYATYPGFLGSALASSPDRRPGHPKDSLILKYLLPLAVPLLFAAATAQADTITTEQLAALMGSVTSGSDVGFLELSAGGTPTSPLPSFTMSASASSPTWNTWSATLTGQVLGSSIDLSYAGGISGNTVTWSTTGTYGPASYSGGGSGTISYPTATSFLLTISDTLVGPGGTYLVAGDLGGTFNTDGSFQLGTPSDLEAGPLAITDDGDLTPGADGYSFRSNANDTSNPNFYRDDHLLFWTFGPVVQTSGFFDSSSSYHDSTIPEPKSGLLAALGLLACLVGRRCRS